MLRVVMYGPDKSENRRIRELLEDILWAAEIKPVFKEGVETVRLAKGANSSACLVWFSDYDYALLAFDLRLTFFGLLPVSHEKAVSALSACYYANGYPPWSDILSLVQSTHYSKLQIAPV